MVNVFGRDAKNGFALRPYDNTGIQYGLTPLLEGKITPAEFVDLNDKLGGWDDIMTKFFDPDNGIVAKIEQGLGVSTGG